MQYELESDKLKRDFGNLGINHVTSSAFIDNIAIFGDWEFELKVVLMDECRLFSTPVRTAVRHIDSLQICPLYDESGKFLTARLTVTGRRPSYLHEWTDIFDVKALLDHHGIFVPDRVRTTRNQAENGVFEKEDFEKKFLLSNVEFFNRLSRKIPKSVQNDVDRINLQMLSLISNIYSKIYDISFKMGAQTENESNLEEVKNDLKNIYRNLEKINCKKEITLFGDGARENSENKRDLDSLNKSIFQKHLIGSNCKSQTNGFEKNDNFENIVLNEVEYLQLKIKNMRNIISSNKTCQEKN